MKKFISLVVVLLLLSGCAARTVHLVVTCECPVVEAEPPTAIPLYFEGGEMIITPNSEQWGINWDDLETLENCVEGPDGTWTCMSEMDNKKEDGDELVE